MAVLAEFLAIPETLQKFTKVYKNRDYFVGAKISNLKSQISNR
jgi:hypothetical protein